MTAPRVTVALSVLNGAAWLAESMDGVLAQDGVDLDLHVLDNGSTDATLTIVDGYLADPRVRLTRNDVDLGFPGSMNRAAVATDAPLFVPWACDDVMLPGHLAASAAAIEATGAGFCFAPVELVDVAGRPTGTWRFGLGPEPALLRAPDGFVRIAWGNPVPMPAVVMRTDALRAVGGFDARVRLTTDWLLWMRLALRFDAAWLPTARVRYREHAENGTSGAWRSGGWARDLPAAIDAAFADEAVPAPLAAHRAEAAMRVLWPLAEQLEGHGHRRHDATPYPAYAVLGRALVAKPDTPGLADRFAPLVQAAGLVAPRRPWDVVAECPADDAAAREAIAILRTLAAAGISSRSAIVCPPDEVEPVVALLEGVLADGPDLDLDLDLVPGELADALLPGAVCLAAHGSSTLALAESRGVPALVHSVPDPMARPRDAGLWELIP